MSVQEPAGQERIHSGETIKQTRGNKRNKARMEKCALEAAENANEPGLKRLLTAIARSSRLSAEDILREAGYMLAQSSNAHKLLEELIDDPPNAGFPIATAQELLDAIPCNDGTWEKRKKGNSGKRRYRCTLCFTEFEVDEGEEPICPMCGAKGDQLEVLD